MNGRVVLVGSSRAGKSTTGNLLLNPGVSDTPFVTSNSINSCSTKVVSKVSPLTQLTVVDTPGLGDSPSKVERETNDQYRKRCRQRSTDFFTAVTTDLRDNGGIILFIQKSADVGPKASRHLEALNKVLHGTFSTHVVLVLTNVPQEFLYTAGESAQTKEQLRMQYCSWLQQTHDEIQVKFSFAFSSVLGICNIRFIDPEHPAHPQKLIEAVKHLRHHMGVGLPCGVAMAWSDLVAERYKVAHKIDEVNKSLNSLGSSIQQLEDEKAKLLKKQNKSANAEIAGVAIMNCEPLLWCVGLPGIAAGAGGIIAGGGSAAKAKYDTKMKDVEGRLRAVREQTAKHASELATLTRPGQTAEQSAKLLRQEAEEIKQLVLSE